MVLPDGSLLKADRPLTLFPEAIFFNPIEDRKIYKAYTVKGKNIIAALFNLCSGKRTLHGQISLSEIDEAGDSLYAVLSARNGFLGVGNRLRRVFGFLMELRTKRMS